MFIKVSSDSTTGELIGSLLRELQSLYLECWELVRTVHKEEASVLENKIIQLAWMELPIGHPGHLDNRLFDSMV